MTEALSALAKGALNDLEGVFAAMPEDALDGLVEAIVRSRRIVVFGLGREGLQMRGFAMRLFRRVGFSLAHPPPINQRRVRAGRRGRLPPRRGNPGSGCGHIAAAMSPW